MVESTNQMLRFNSERKKTWIERVERQKHTLRDLYPFMENFPSPIWTRSVLQEAAENVEKVMARKVKEPIIGLEVDERFQTYIWIPDNWYCGPDSVPSLVYERYSHIARNRGMCPIGIGRPSVGRGWRVLHVRRE